MKFTFISDTHTKHHNLNTGSGDVLIHCGDFTNRGELPSVLSFAQYMQKQDFKYKIVIAGNHDFCFEDERKAQAEKCFEDHDIIYLNDSGVDINGIKIWGSPVQPAFFDWAFNRKRGEELRAHWALIPEDTDILLTHGPAYGILDHCPNGRVGCEDLLVTINKIKPKVHAFGHIHEGYGVLEQEGTTFINACSLDSRYCLKNAPITLTLDVLKFTQSVESCVKLPL